MSQPDAPSSSAAHVGIAPAAPASWPATASAPAALIKVLDGVRYATSTKGRQQVNQAEANLFTLIIVSGVIWILLRTLIPIKKRTKK